ncbi:transcriptional regulator (plasmid) [Azospirillum sp. B510]|uniref:LysR family transcriptional regulator n=1 Tax=Azospirillum sp. (strain B510) TaxID=137722 RepID=UPI0001C4C8F3|nr:LysR family transcriptional regulator [Azospirillum sp. B510]BAI75676.1 transcriptional regulator [Azospirillum sp. B510]
MRFKRLDLNLLVALDALLRERNVSRAADGLNLSQSAMSNALARLRDYFNDDLLVQVGRKMELTPQAESLAESVRDILLRIDTAIAVQPEFIAADSKRTFNLLVSEYTTSVLMPTLLSLVHREAKNISFRFLPQNTSPEAMLTSGDADLLIMPENFIPPGHPSEQLYEDDFSCVVWRDSAAFGETLTVEEYLAASHIVAEFAAARASYESWFIKRYGAERRIAVVTPSFLTLCPLVVGTDCIATVHSRIARQALESLPIRLLPLPVEIPKLIQMVQWHKYRSQDPGLKWLRGHLRTAGQRIQTR